MSDRKAIFVIGAGDATGGAIARRFSREYLQPLLGVIG